MFIPHLKHSPIAEYYFQMSVTVNNTVVKLFGHRDRSKSMMISKNSMEMELLNQTYMFWSFPMTLLTQRIFFFFIFLNAFTIVYLIKPGALCYIHI